MSAPEDVLGRGIGGMTSEVDVDRVDIDLPVLGTVSCSGGEGKNFLSEFLMGVTGVCGHRYAVFRVFIFVA